MEIRPLYIAGSRGGKKGVRGGVSPYGPKGTLKNWTLAEKQELAKKIESIILEVCQREDIHWMRVYGTCRSKERDRIRVIVLQEVYKQTGVAPSIVARCFACDRTTVISALKGGRGKQIILS